MQNRPRPWLLAALLLLGINAASAQTPGTSSNPPAANAATSASAPPQRAIERLRTEDAGARIDELRVGGETQSISVQPAGNAPAYEVRPADANRPGTGAGDGAGARFWNIFKF